MQKSKQACRHAARWICFEQHQHQLLTMRAPKVFQGTHSFNTFGQLALTWSVSALVYLVTKKLNRLVR